MNDRPADFPRKSPHHWGDITVEPGELVEVSLAVAQSYSSLPIQIPIVVHRGLEPGPTVFVTAAIHGDEINGTGAIRALIRDRSHPLQRGTLILVPVMNILGFERHSRYLPDRRDLNRCFPGSDQGSQAQRMARILFDEIVSRSDYGIDLHTAAIRRTNFPNVRADMEHPDVARLARAFGCEIILNGAGPKGSFRREATATGCPTIILEAGEVWKVEPGIVDYTTAGVYSVLRELQMLDTPPRRPTYQLILDKSQWVRASRGGILRFHVSPGDLVRAESPLATYTTLTGVENGQILAPRQAIILGMTTLPCVTPGEPICHLGLIPHKFSELEKIRSSLPDNNLHDRVLGDLSTNIRVVRPTE